MLFDYLLTRFKPHPRYAQNPDYRPDVDGLRALAVMLVVLFHLGMAGLPGGYVGVDMFFVISGYLITGHIYREVVAGHFSFSGFYERRVRRLAPGMLSMLLLTLLLSVLALSPKDLIRAAESSVASLLFVANIFFYQKQDYFATDSDTNPLLHMWSLGVEEQFYLLWPLLLVLLFRRGNLRIVWGVVGALALLSLGAAIRLGHTDSAAAFYLMPTRLFEFAIGAALVWLPEIRQWRKPISDALVILGLVCIGLSVAKFNQHTPFPSYAALLPCLGTALIIYAGRDPVVRMFLGHPALAYIGRFSYELYLFHWPLIVLTRYLTFGDVTPRDNALVLLASFGISMLTYHCISSPLRFGFATTPRRRQNFLLGTLVVAIAMLGAATIIKLQKGLPQRVNHAATEAAQNPGEFHKSQFGGAGYTENTILTLGTPGAPPQFLLIGDSFAAQYAVALSEFLAARHQSAQTYFLNGCLIAPEVSVHDRGQLEEDCAGMHARTMALLQQSNLPVIFAQSWTSYKNSLLRRDGTRMEFPTESNDAYYDYMITVIDQMRTAIAPRKLVVIGIAPGITEQKALSRCFDIPSYLPTRCLADVSSPEAARQHGQEFNRAAAAYVKAHPDVTFINPRDAFCRDGQCYAIRSQKVYYSDNVHFTKDGARAMLKYHEATFTAIHP